MKTLLMSLPLAFLWLAGTADAKDDVMTKVESSDGRSLQLWRTACAPAGRGTCLEVRLYEGEKTRSRRQLDTPFPSGKLERDKGSDAYQEIWQLSPGKDKTEDGYTVFVRPLPGALLIVTAASEVTEAEGVPSLNNSLFQAVNGQVKMTWPPSGHSFGDVYVPERGKRLESLLFMEASESFGGKPTPLWFEWEDRGNAWVRKAGTLYAVAFAKSAPPYLPDPLEAWADVHAACPKLPGAELLSAMNFEVSLGDLAFLAYPTLDKESAELRLKGLRSCKAVAQAKVVAVGRVEAE